jgi:hypothetical protein
LVEGAVGTDIDQAATNLIDGITPEMITKWSASDPTDWANESFAIAEATKTHYCVMHAPSCDKPDGDVTINSEYLSANEAVVKEQLGWRPSRAPTRYRPQEKRSEPSAEQRPEWML